jgi:hypothetical protein
VLTLLLACLCLQPVIQVRFATAQQTAIKFTIERSRCSAPEAGTVGGEQGRVQFAGGDPVCKVLRDFVGAALTREWPLCRMVAFERGDDLDAFGRDHADGDLDRGFQIPPQLGHQAWPGAEPARDDAPPR